MPEISKLFFIIFYTHHHGRKTGSAYGHAISQSVFVVFQVTEQKHVHLGHMDADYVKTFNNEANVFGGNLIKKVIWRELKSNKNIREGTEILFLYIMGCQCYVRKYI